MNASLWVTLIIGIATPLLTLIGVIITNNRASLKQNKKVDEYKDLTIYRIEQLEKKQDKHNTLMERMFIVEGEISELQHEVRDLKNKHSK